MLFQGLYLKGLAYTEKNQIHTDLKTLSRQPVTGGKGNKSWLPFAQASCSSTKEHSLGCSFVFLHWGLLPRREPHRDSFSLKLSYLQPGEAKADEEIGKWFAWEQLWTIAERIYVTQFQVFKPNLISIHLCKITLCIPEPFLSFSPGNRSKVSITGKYCQYCSCCKDDNSCEFFSCALKGYEHIF